MNRTLALLVLLSPQLLLAQIHISGEDAGGFPIATAQSVASIVYDPADYPVVKKTAELLATDILNITDQKPKLIQCSEKKKGILIIVGTIGTSRIIDKLVKDGKIDVSQIEGGWERFTLQTVDKPMKGVKKGLVIAGSDKRGTAYGVFSLSEAIGVSPWYWWADVPVKKSETIFYKGDKYVSKAPSVKYRGVFLNDEDWGLHPWAAKNMDPDLGDIGPNAYEKIFELLLRLKANMVAPAMHECTKAFYTVPGNMEMADQYGIMITTSHCEPLLYNNASEWDKKTQGEWNYSTNKEEINRALEDRVKQAHENENIYTIALRGLHDEGMKGGSEEEKLNSLSEAIKDQRGLLAKYKDQPLEEVPQIFVPYKEVLGLYEKGLDVPKDITIVWPDDNYGYIKKLSNETEQKRDGGAGVYYHISYLGWPNDYLWLNTTHPALMFAEMHKAYHLGSQKYWLVNVGDIKPGELGMQTFLNMAWDFDRFNFENINDYQVNILTSIFGEAYRDDLDYILNRYYFHGFARKPEYMTWDWRWNSLFGEEQVKDTDFSFVNYNEAENRLNEYGEIAGMAKSIMGELSEEKKAAFYELVYYPVKGASLYNHEMLIAQKNRWYAKQGRALTNELSERVRLYHDSIATLTKQYNELLDGKWNGMMTAPGFLPKEQLSPDKTIDLPGSAHLGVFVEGKTSDSSTLSLPVFHEQFDNSYFFEVYSKSTQPAAWEATAPPFITLSKNKGITRTQERIQVSIDWSKAPNKKELHEEIEISGPALNQAITVSAKRAPELNDPMFTANNGVISINPVDFHRKTENDSLKFQIINELGYSNASLQLGHAKLDTGAGSFIEYDFYVDKASEINIYTYMLPLFAKDRQHGTRYGVQIDDQEWTIHSNDPKEYSREWAANVIRNSAINQSNFHLDKPGKHTLKIFAIDPGMILQKILIDSGGLKGSYLGPKTTLDN